MFKDLALAILLLAAGPAPLVVEDTVDLIELNHLYDRDAERCYLQQIIFWSWNHERGKYEVRAWRLLRDKSQLPIADGRGWVATWHDGETLWRVKAKHFRFTRTFVDPEVEDRTGLPKELRWALYEARATGKPIDVTR